MKLLSEASRLRMDPQKRREIWAAVEREMAHPRLSRRSWRWERLIGPGTAAALMVGVCGGTLILLFHHPVIGQKQAFSSAENGTAMATSGPNATKAASAAGIGATASEENAAAAQDEKVQASGGILPGNTTPDAITLDDIRRYYQEQPTLSGRPVQVVSVHPYPAYHAIIVETRWDPTLFSEFDWWDLRTGRHFPLAGRSYEVQLEQVASPEQVVLRATGRYSETPGIDFPYDVYAERPDAESDFTVTRKPARLPVSESVSFGDGKVEAAAEVTSTSDAITIIFQPLPGLEGPFMAGAFGAPKMRTEYAADRREMTIHFASTQATVASAVLAKVHNAYVDGVSARKNGSEWELILHLTDKARFYTASVEHHTQASVTFAFSSE